MLVNGMKQYWMTDGDIEKSADYAPGLPSRDNLGDASKLTPGSLVPYVVQAHRAYRAGQHDDIRLGKDKMMSWATKQGLPPPGGKSVLFQQPEHREGYKYFEGTIPMGYGAGEVRRSDLGDVLITESNPHKIKFVIAHSRVPSEYTLVRLGGGKGAIKSKKPAWYMFNTTPTAIGGRKKVKYKSIPAEEIDKLFDPKYVMSAKIDGAAAFVKLMQDKVHVVSPRDYAATGYPIVQTHKLDLAGRPIRIPKELQGLLLKGELYGEQGGKAIPPQALGGLLNSTIAKSRRDQKLKNIQMRIALFGVAERKGVPFKGSQSEAEQLIGESLKHLPQDIFTTPPTATTPEAKRKMWEDIISGKNPLTSEGVVGLPVAGGVPVKVKPRKEVDVWIRKITGGKGNNKGAGGFFYSLSDRPDAPIVGKVGTGFSADTRAAMSKDPTQFLGRRARISAQEQFPSGAFRAPSFIAVHEDYPAGTFDKAAAYLMGFTKAATVPIEVPKHYDITVGDNIDGKKPNKPSIISEYSKLLAKLEASSGEDLSQVPIDVFKKQTLKNLRRYYLPSTLRQVPSRLANTTATLASPLLAAAVPLGYLTGSGLASVGLGGLRQLRDELAATNDVPEPGNAFYHKLFGNVSLANPEPGVLAHELGHWLDYERNKSVMPRGLFGGRRGTVTGGLPEIDSELAASAFAIKNMPNMSPAAKEDLKAALASYLRQTPVTRTTWEKLTRMHKARINKNWKAQYLDARKRKDKRGMRAAIRDAIVSARTELKTPWSTENTTGLIKFKPKARIARELADTLMGEALNTKAATIRHEGNKWILYNHAGTKVLGRHPSKEKALAQERAIQVHKHGSADSWIGVDLDGSLAKYDGWKGDTHIGAPIPKMVGRVKRWLATGQRVKIFTARAHDMSPEAKRAVQRWCKKHLGHQLPITNVKDPKMRKLWDDRAVGLYKNTGNIKAAAEEPADVLKPPASMKVPEVVSSATVPQPPAITMKDIVSGKYGIKNEDITANVSKLLGADVTPYMDTIKAVGDKTIGKQPWLARTKLLGDALRRAVGKKPKLMGRAEEYMTNNPIGNYTMSQMTNDYPTASSDFTNFVQKAISPMMDSIVGGKTEKNNAARDIDISDLEKLYDTFDKGHDSKHRDAVASIAQELAAKHAPRQQELAVLAAKLHDIGLSKSRDDHEVHGAEMIAADPRFGALSQRHRQLLVNAVRQHRASTGRPRSTIGRIVSDADRLAGNAASDAIRRAVEYGKVHDPALNDKEQVARAVAHLADKFSPGGPGRRHYFPETGERLGEVYDPIVAMHRSGDLTDAHKMVLMGLDKAAGVKLKPAQIKAIRRLLPLRRRIVMHYGNDPLHRGSWEFSRNINPQAEHAWERLDMDGLKPPGSTPAGTYYPDETGGQIFLKYFGSKFLHGRRKGLANRRHELIHALGDMVDRFGDTAPKGRVPLPIQLAAMTNHLPKFLPRGIRTMLQEVPAFAGSQKNEVLNGLKRLWASREHYLNKTSSAPAIALLLGDSVSKQASGSTNSVPTNAVPQTVKYPISRLYNAIASAETGGETYPWIRTKVIPKTKAESSTAYGPLQMTRKLVADYTSRLKHKFTPETLKYANEVFIPQADKFIHHGLLQGQQPGPDYDPNFGYGGRGTIGDSPEYRAGYTNLGRELLKIKYEEAGYDPAKLMSNWRGTNAEPAYIERFNTTLNAAPKVPSVKSTAPSIEPTVPGTTPAQDVQRITAAGNK